MKNIMKKKIVILIVLFLIFVSFSNIVNSNKIENKLSKNTISQTTVCNDCYLGFKISEDWYKNARFVDVNPSSSLPSSFDWRNEFTLPPVEKQGCGDCWAFAATGLVECAIKKQDNEFVDISEQWLLSCNGAGFGCDGGYLQCLDYFCRYDADDEGGIGAVMEDDFKYQGDDTVECRKKDHVHRIDNWRYIDDGDGDISNPCNIECLKQAIYDYGPISCSVYCDSINWFGHSTLNPNGIYDGEDYDPNSDEPSTNHKIILVGWNDDPGYFIIRNSWGKGFCNNGYMKMKYNINNLGSYAVVVEYSGNGNEFEENKDGDEYSNKNGDVKKHNNYVELSGGFDGGRVDYKLKVDENQNYDLKEKIWVGVQLKDTSLDPWNDGPDFYVKKGDNWVKLKSGMGEREEYTWSWRILNSPKKYMDSEGNIHLRVKAGGDDCTFVRRVGIKYGYSYPDLDASANKDLEWSDVNPGTTKTGYISVTNIGDVDSKLDWEVEESKDWISCSPDSGSNLEYDDSQQIRVTVYASNSHDTERSAIIKVKNSDDSNDFEEYNVMIETKEEKSKSFQINILKFLQYKFIFFNEFISKIIDMRVY